MIRKNLSCSYPLLYHCFAPNLTSLPTDQINNEKELLQRLSLGDETAFASIYDLYAPSLISFAGARLISLEEARDIIHDLFVYLWAEREHLIISHSLKAFLFATTRYRIIDHIRRNVKRREYIDKLQLLPESVDGNIDNDLDAKELHLAIEKAVDQLPPRTREIYRLSRHEHLTVAEIAGQLSISEQTVKNQLTTALSHLRSFISRLSVLFWWL